MIETIEHIISSQLKDNESMIHYMFVNPYIKKRTQPDNHYDKLIVDLQVDDLFLVAKRVFPAEGEWDWLDMPYLGKFIVDIMHKDMLHRIDDIKTYPKITINDVISRVYVQEKINFNHDSITFSVDRFTIKHDNFQFKKDRYIGAHQFHFWYDNRNATDIEHTEEQLCDIQAMRNASGSVVKNTLINNKQLVYIDYFLQSSDKNNMFSYFGMGQIDIMTYSKIVQSMPFIANNKTSSLTQIIKRYIGILKPLKIK